MDNSREMLRAILEAYDSEYGKHDPLRTYGNVKPATVNKLIICVHYWTMKKHNMEVENAEQWDENTKILFDKKFIDNKMPSELVVGPKSVIGCKEWKQLPNYKYGKNKFGCGLLTLEKIKNLYDKLGKVDIRDEQGIAQQVFGHPKSIAKKLAINTVRKDRSVDNWEEIDAASDVIYQSGRTKSIKMQRLNPNHRTMATQAIREMKKAFEKEYGNKADKNFLIVVWWLYKSKFITMLNFKRGEDQWFWNYVDQIESAWQQAEKDGFKPIKGNTTTEKFIEYLGFSPSTWRRIADRVSKLTQVMEA